MTSLFRKRKEQEEAPGRNMEGPARQLPAEPKATVSIIGRGMTLVGDCRATTPFGGFPLATSASQVGIVLDRDQGGHQEQPADPVPAAGCGCLEAVRSASRHLDADSPLLRYGGSGSAPKARNGGSCSPG